MISETQTRELLTASCHSSVKAQNRVLAELQSQEFVSLLVHIAVDANDLGGDAPMQAAYYLSRAPSQLTKPHEETLRALLTTANGYAGSIALILGRMKSLSAKSSIARMAAEGYWPKELFAEALSHYEA